jgi:PD-(D/E)XK nuclease superfamily
MEEEKLQELLNEAGKLSFVRREKNIFSLGGRGYYEEPMSDLLAFFFDPQEEHGLGDLALTSLAEFLQNAPVAPLTLAEPPTREYTTPAGNYIDLVLNGDRWVIALENKITHAPLNPFEEYRAAVNADGRFDGKDKYFVILSPSQASVENWKWVGTQNWVASIHQRLGTQFVRSGLSKWTVFLREFLILIENQTGGIMDLHEFEFVQRNYPTVVNVLKLRDGYLNALQERVRQTTSETLGREPARTARRDWHQYGIALCVYLRQDRQHYAVLLVLPGGGFRVQYYVQANMVRTEVNRSEFKAGGTFED